MASLYEGPFFNLKAVVRQTGLKPDTLRAWERRYGLPSPARSGGKHRLYTQHDIDTIRWLTARQSEGLSISRAVELWMQFESEGRDPLRSAVPAVYAVAPVSALRSTGRTVVGLREEWLAACLAYDEQAAEGVLAQAFSLYPPEGVCLELLLPVIAEVGALWYRGALTVQQEHFASALAVRRLESLITAAPPPLRPGRILAACPPEEHHVLGLLLLTFLLRRRGWAVAYLGADVPVEQLETTIGAVRPQLVILAAQQLHTAATLLEAARAVQQERVPLAYGGLVFNGRPTLQARIPGHFLGESLEIASQAADRLMTLPQEKMPVEAAPETLLRARDHYRERLDLIEAQVDQSAGMKGLAPRYIELANLELARNIDAALSLGDPDLLGADVQWLEGLLQHRGAPTEALHRYLSAYYEATRGQLDERGLPLVTWLRRFAGN